MKISQIEYSRYEWKYPLRNHKDPMCIKIKNDEMYAIVTLKRIEWKDQY